MQAASPLPEQVRAVVDILAGKGSHASQSLQSFIQTSNSQLYLHITVYGRQPAWSQRGGVHTWPGACWSTLRCAQSWGVVAAPVGASVRAMVPSQGLCWGRTQPGVTRALCQVWGNLSPGLSLPSAHLPGQPEESLMSSMSRSPVSPSTGRGTAKGQLTLTPSTGGYPNSRLSLQPSCQQRFPGFTQG